MDSAGKSLLQERSTRNSLFGGGSLGMFPVATDAEHHTKQLGALVAPSQPQRSQQTPRSPAELIHNSSPSTWGGGKAPLLWSHTKGTARSSCLNSRLPPGSELGKGGSGKTNWLKAAHGREMMQRKCLRHRSIGRAHPTRSSEQPAGSADRCRGFGAGAGFVRAGGSGRAPPAQGAGKAQIPGMRLHGARSCHTRQPQHGQEKMSDPDGNSRRKEDGEKSTANKHIHRMPRGCRERKNKVILKTN